MPPSNFEKRKVKTPEAVINEITKKRDAIREKGVEVDEPVYTQSGYDVYTLDGGRNYGVAEISYNPETGAAKVNNTFTISRLVALKYANTKQALGILKKGK